MQAKLTAKDIHYEGPTATRAYVLGWQSGPTLLVVGGNYESAMDEMYERYGTRVEPDDAALLDYEGKDTEERIVSAMECGEIRCTDSGTMVWVDHYEWCVEFHGKDAVRRAGRYFRTGEK